MAQLIVRNLSDDLVDALKQRAAKRKHSAEQPTSSVNSEKATRPTSASGLFFAQTSSESVDLYLSAVTIGEMRQGVERI